jgi:hypothetical protein
MTSHIRSRTFDWTVTKAIDGWKPNCCPNFDPGLAHVVAHDVLEHLDDRSAFDGELRAFGVTLYGRFYGNPENMYEASASDLDVFLAMQNYKVPKPPHGLANKPLDAGAERMLSALLSDTEINAANTAPMHKTGEQRTLVTNVEKFRSVKEDVRGWIRIGYRVAARRYKKLGHIGLDTLFGKLVDAVIKDARRDFPKPGDTLKIDVDLKTFKFTLKRGQLSPAEILKAEAAARIADPRHGKPRTHEDELQDVLRAIFGN